MVTIPVQGSLRDGILPDISAVAGVEVSPQRRTSEWLVVLADHSFW
jgi:hypothetical protein